MNIDSIAGAAPGWFVLIASEDPETKEWDHWTQPIAAWALIRDDGTVPAEHGGFQPVVALVREGHTGCQVSLEPVHIGDPGVVGIMAPGETISLHWAERLEVYQKEHSKSAQSDTGP